MQAIILAAGMGKRLKELTQDRTKCMVQVNGVALIDRMLHRRRRRDGKHGEAHGVHRHPGHPDAYCLCP